MRIKSQGKQFMYLSLYQQADGTCVAYLMFEFRTDLLHRRYIHMIWIEVRKNLRRNKMAQALMMMMEEIASKTLSDSSCRPILTSEMPMPTPDEGESPARQLMNKLGYESLVLRPEEGPPGRSCFTVNFKKKLNR